MINPSFNELLGRYFSIDALARDSTPLRRVLNILSDWLTPEHQPPYPTTPFERLTESFNDYSMPEHGMGVDAILDEISGTILPNTARLNHPMYIGHMTQALPWISVLVEAVIAALNQNQVKIETAYVSTLIEKQVIGWMHRTVYKRDDAYYAAAMRERKQALGNVVNGGTMGNLTALAVALERILPGTRKYGLPAALARSRARGVAVLGSVRMHYSLKKAVATLGLGEQALHTIPVDSDNRIDLVALEAKLEELKRERICVISIIGIAGTTETGAVDPLMELSAIARREKAWFHVDAAWGGALLLGNRLNHMYDGVEQADSIVIDGHKLLWVPIAQSMVLFKEIGSLNSLRHNANYIIRHNSGDLGQTSLEGSRRFDALKLWASFKVIGADGYSTLLTKAESISDSMRALLQAQRDFELTSDSRNFILTYRFVPCELRRDLHRLLEAGDLSGAAAINRRVNALNALLQERQKTNGKSFVSRTVLESVACPEGLTVLRVVLTNVTTTPAHLRAIVSEQRALGTALAQELAVTPDYASGHSHESILPRTDLNLPDAL